MDMRPSGRNAVNNLLAKSFPSETLALAGAQSAASLRSMPVRYLFLRAKASSDDILSAMLSPGGWDGAYLILPSR